MTAAKIPSPAASDPVQENGLHVSQLATLRATLLEQRQWLGNAGDTEPDSQAAAADAEVAAELRLRGVEEIALIDDALERMRDGRYGSCCDCHNPIGFPRLRAWPMARRCIDCKTRYEEQSGSQRS